MINYLIFQRLKFLNLVKSKLLFGQLFKIFDLSKKSIEKNCIFEKNQKFEVLKKLFKR